MKKMTDIEKSLLNQITYLQDTLYKVMKYVDHSYADLPQIYKDNPELESFFDEWQEKERQDIALKRQAALDKLTKEEIEILKIKV
jgi:hypothetical protein